ncbi:hypothetical protein M113_0945 [Bacteroides fragilis str. 3986 N3]|uniref:Uncharacterized protein n=1 Tax=Bacteroides fragilis str. 1007-1-F \|nr:hypothetical protein M117_0741 [Bacteroides fragilis str. 3774 T13]EXZ40832.1 hypothetical protein M100_0811 [Bacteroides fragilis str. 1007-1-F \
MFAKNKSFKHKTLLLCQQKENTRKTALTMLTKEETTFISP